MLTYDRAERVLTRLNDALINWDSPGALSYEDVRDAHSMLNELWKYYEEREIVSVGALHGG